MSKSVLDDAFRHHVWASLRLLDACAPLSDEQLATAVPGTYGSILATMQHIVGSDSGYLFRLTGGRIERIDEEQMGIAELRTAMQRNAAAWPQVVIADLNPDTVIVGRSDDGSETHAPVGIRVAQALHHGTDHRSQVCTALTTLGIEPPAIDVWDFGMDNGRTKEVPPKS
jgi:uncharacterized damage-inducible protein DinB